MLYLFNQYVKKLNKQDIILELFNTKDFNRVLYKKMQQRSCTQFFDDLKQDIFIILMEKDEDLIQALHFSDRLKFYAVRIILNQVFSTSSPFYKNYINTIQGSENDIDISCLEFTDEDYKEFDVLKYCTENSILTWYEENILSIYYKLGLYKHNDDKVTLRGIEEEYGIDHISIYLTLESAKEKIKEHIKKNKVKL